MTNIFLTYPMIRTLHRKLLAHHDEAWARELAKIVTIPQEYSFFSFEVHALLEE